MSIGWHPCLDSFEYSAGHSTASPPTQEPLAHAAAQSIHKSGRRSLVPPCDLTQRDTVEALLDAVYAEFGAVDILVNCAGTTQRTPALDVPEDEWKCILDTNLNGALRTCQIFGRKMIERRYGRIINVASLSSLVALYEVAAYGASKAALASLTRSLAIEWARYGVCVNAIVPGVFRTEMNSALLDGSPRGAPPPLPARWW